MATRRPIVVVAGQRQELPSGDKIPLDSQDPFAWYFPVTGSGGTTTANITLKPGVNIIGIRSTAMNVVLNLTGPANAVATYRWNREPGSNMLAGVTVNRL